jgi:hypothetical protein
MGHTSKYVEAPDYPDHDCSRETDPEVRLTHTAGNGEEVDARIAKALDDCTQEAERAFLKLTPIDFNRNPRILLGSAGPKGVFSRLGNNRSIPPRLFQGG